MNGQQTICLEQTLPALVKHLVSQAIPAHDSPSQ